jgi:endonuclease YncB( thermonuclease family)
MLKRGLATIYEAKSGVEFGKYEQKYRDAEAKARERNVGMWSQPGILQRILGAKEVKESPMEFKKRMKAEEGRNKK